MSLVLAVAVIRVEQGTIASGEEDTHEIHPPPLGFPTSSCSGLRRGCAGLLAICADAADGVEQLGLFWHDSYREASEGTGGCYGAEAKALWLDLSHSGHPVV